jgi:hypothetical protein
MASLYYPPSTPDIANDLIYLGNPAGISAYAAMQTDAANVYLLRLGDATAGLAPPVISAEFPTGGSAPAITVTPPPTMTEVVWTAPAAPAEFTEDLDVDDFLPEPFTETAPTLVFGTAPAEFTNPVPDAPGVDLSFAMPELDLTLPARPDLLAISVSKFGGMNLPTFDADAPQLDLVAPSIREYVPGEQYTSALLTALQTSLLERVTEGGTGLNQDVENAIWDRGREREARSKRAALDELEQMEDLGYALPPGIYLDARVKIATETDYAERGHSREVMIKSAELELDNVKHALTTATALEGQTIEYTNAVEQRLFEASRYATEAGVAIYNAKVQAFGALVDAYRAQVQVYEAQIRGEIAKVEAYKAEVEAESAKAQINRALVDQYQAEITAALANVEVFKARIDAVRVRAEIEKTKVEIYGEQVRGYVAQVNAYTAGVEGFRARIQAEATKQEAFTSQVNAYRAQVDANSKVIDARIATYRGKLDAFVAQWDAYKSAYQAEAARAAAIGSLNSSRADAYRAEVQGVASYNDVLTRQWQAALDQAQRVSEIGINTAKANAELYMTTRSLALDAAKVGAQVSAQLGAAAINTINWSTSYSNSISKADSTSRSDALTVSNSVSSSTSTNYNYNASV